MLEFESQQRLIDTGAEECFAEGVEGQLKIMEPARLALRSIENLSLGNRDDLRGEIGTLRKQLSDKQMLLMVP